MFIYLNAITPPRSISAKTRTMEHIIQNSQKTPYVRISSNEGIIEFKGNSYQDKPGHFYNGILDLIQDLKNNHNQIEFHLKLEYLNSTSEESLLKLIHEVERDTKSSIKWHYNRDNFEMRLKGEDYCEKLSSDFEFIEHVEDNNDHLFAHQNIA